MVPCSWKKRKFFILSFSRSSYPKEKTTGKSFHVPYKICFILCTSYQHLLYRNAGQNQSTKFQVGTRHSATILVQHQSTHPISLAGYQLILVVDWAQWSHLNFKIHHLMDHHHAHKPLKTSPVILVLLNKITRQMEVGRPYIFSQSLFSLCCWI